MHFECFKCGKAFDEIKFVISHLKLNHFIKNDTIAMKCLVAGNVCEKEFYCFNKLKNHMKECKSTPQPAYKPKPGFRQTNLEKSFEDFHISDQVSK